MDKSCPVCHDEKANIHPTLKILPGLRCQKRMGNQTLPAKQIEFTSPTIKEQRKEYARSIVQPYRGGQLSKEYLNIYGTKGIKATPEQIKSARNVWTEDYSPNLDIRKSK